MRPSHSDKVGSVMHCTQTSVPPGQALGNDAEPQVACQVDGERGDGAAGERVGDSRISGRCDQRDTGGELLTFALRAKEKLRWRHDHDGAPARLARRTATTRLGAAAAGREAAGYRRRARGDLLRLAQGRQG
jgi:hypothetical protein